MTPNDVANAFEKWVCAIVRMAAAEVLAPEALRADIEKELQQARADFLACIETIEKQ